ncbi:MAG: hypothetical protein NTV94_18425 [Planctomycetota bacterium]|nr:hypothetical protein [Planctomycetota bacterium]
MRARAPWILLGLSLLSAGLYLADGAAAVILHPVLGLFSHGTSAGKIYFLLAFLAAFSFLWGIRTLQTRLKNPDHATSLRIQRFYVAAVLIGGAAGLLSFATYAASMGLSWRETSLHWENGFNSSNSLTHMHTTKAALAMGVELIGWSAMHARFDTGIAYLPNVPHAVCVVIGVSFLVTLATALWAGPRFAAAGLARGDWAGGVILALALGSVSKCLLDGGPPSYDFIAGLVATAFVVRGGATRESWLARRWTWILMALSAWIATIGVLSFDSVDYQIMQLVRRLSLYGLIALAGAAEARRTGVKRIVVAAASMLVTAHSLYGAMALRVVPLFGVPPGRVVSHESGTRPGSSVPGDSAFAAYARNHERPHRVLWTSTLAGTSPVATGFFADIKVIDGPAVLPWVTPDGSISVSTATDAAAALAGRTHLKVVFSGADAPVLFRDAPNSQLDENEKFVAYRLFDRQMRAHGINRYVLIPYDAFRERGEHALAIRDSHACACCESSDSN